MKRRKRGLRGQAEQKDLEIYIDNEEPLYRQKLAIHKSLDAKVKSGRFDKTKAPKAFSYMVDAGARKYAKEFGGSVRTMFPKSDRDAVAREYTKEYMSERGLKGLKGRGMRGLGRTDAEHLAKTAYDLRDFKKLLKESTKKRGVYSCENALDRVRYLQATVSRAKENLSSVRSREERSTAKYRKLKSAVNYAQEQVEAYTSGFSRVCLLDFDAHKTVKIRLARRAGWRRAPNTAVSTSTLSGTRRKRKAQR